METPKTKAYMDRYVQENKPDLLWDYFDAYRARRVNNHHCLLEFAEELSKMGYECFVYEDDWSRECCNTLLIKKGGLETHCGFAEVPYRWYIGSAYNGLTKGLYVGEDTWNFPLEPNEIEAYMRPRTARYESPYKHKLN